MGSRCSCFSFVDSPQPSLSAALKDARRPSVDQAKADNDRYDVKIQFLLGRVPLLRGLPKDSLPLVAAHCELEVFEKGATVVRQGEEGHEFFLIQTGTAGVHMSVDDDEPTRLKTLKVGDYFGEKALLFDALRSATIIAESHLEVLKISREKFHSLGLNHKLNFPKRPNVGGARAVGRNVATQPATEKTCEDRAFIAQALRKNRRLQEAVSLDDSRIQKMIDIAWKQDVKAGHNLISEGDLDADFFYVVQDGIFGKTQKEDFLTLSQPLMIRDSAGLWTEDTANSVEIGRGDSFGEIALLYLVPRTATITAKTNSTVWVFDRQNFKNILMKASSAQIKENRRHLDRVLLLESLFQEEKEALAEILVEMSYSENECIMQQGESGNSFHILIEGKVAVIEDEEKVRDLSASLNGEAHAFGEKALLQNDVRTATVKVVSATAKTLVLDRGSFNLLLGPLKDIISGRTPSRSKRSGSTAEQIVADSVAILADSTSQPSSAERPTKKNKTLSQLRKISLLGCGAFGAVELHEDRATGETYAVKVMSKGFIVENSMEECVCQERRILMLVDSSFIIQLYGAHNGSQTLSFILELGLGGDLYLLYGRNSFYGLENHARFYTAGVVGAFEYLHDRHIIYRDLKPENILLNEKGYSKLCDMGFAKFVIGRTYTTCGTPDYFAPEIINSSGHNRAVDWWALGILAFELMSGHPPFESHDPMRTIAKVQAGIDKIQFPKKCQGNVASLIRASLKKQPSERLAMRPGGVSNVKGHTWYNGFDWESLASGIMKAPYVPAIKSNKDVKHFSPNQEELPPMVYYRKRQPGPDKFEAEFGPVQT